MNEIDPRLLGEALVVWTGNGTLSWPHRLEDKLVERYGSLVAADLLPRLMQLERDFYESDAQEKAGDRVEMGDLAAARFRQLHPEIPEAGVDALRWCYTFDWR